MVAALCLPIYTFTGKSAFYLVVLFSIVYITELPH